MQVMVRFNLVKKAFERTSKVGQKEGTIVYL